MSFGIISTLNVLLLCHQKWMLVCFVSYIPLENGFSLCSNRDEQASRSPSNISVVVGENHLPLYSPKDTAAGGSWIGYEQEGRVACLLNGAFVKHAHLPPYSKSRGVMLFEFFTFSSVEAFTEGFDFVGMEPFTLIVVEKGGLWEIRWDASMLHVLPLDAQQAYAWSSSTLYDVGTGEKRRKAFFDLLPPNHIQPSDVLYAQTHALLEDGWNGLMMNREQKVQTVSTTLITHTHLCQSMQYLDHLSKTFLEKFW